MEIESILFVHFDQLRVIDYIHIPLTKVEEVILPFNDDDSFLNSTVTGTTNLSNITTQRTVTRMMRLNQFAAVL